MKNFIISKKNDLTFYILLSIILGILTGLLLNPINENPWVQSLLINGFFELGGRIFISSLKLLVVPMVFVSLVCGVISLKEISTLKRIGLKTIAFYLVSTSIAISIAIAFALIFKPGIGFELTTSSQFQSAPAPSIVEIISNIIPSNPLKAMVDGQMLQIIFLALLFGLAISLLKEKAQKVQNIFIESNEIILKLVFIIIWIAPFGVFCLLSKVFALEGYASIVPLMKYFLAVLFVLLFQMLVVYPTFLKIFSKISPLYFFSKIKKILAFAFSTSSSNATLPITIEETEKQLGVSNEVASFTLPLGATINMDGTAIMQGVATIFIAQVYGIDIGIVGILSVILMATLASIGTAGVPGVGLITLTMVLSQVGLPVEGIGLIIGVDRLLDMTRTCVNITGDVAFTYIVAESEGKVSTQPT